MRRSGASAASTAYLSLIRYLLDSGATPNTIRSPDPTYMRNTSGGTALDMFAESLTGPHHNMRTDNDIGHAIYLSLVDNGGEFSKPLDFLTDMVPTFWFGAFETQIVQLQKFGELVEGNCNHSHHLLKQNLTLLA